MYNINVEKQYHMYTGTHCCLWRKQTIKLSLSVIRALHESANAGYQGA